MKHPSQRRKLTPEQELELVADYKADELSWKDMAKKYGIHPDTISVYLDRMGVTRTRKPEIPHLMQALVTRERERRYKALERENRKFRSYVQLLLRRQAELEEQVRSLGGVPVTQDTWRVGQPRKK